jgi:hypothetical protein
LFTAATALATAVSVAGCTDSAVSEARSLVRQATPSIPSLTAIWEQIKTELPRLPGELGSAAVGVVTNPVPAVVAAVLPDPITSSSGGGATGGVSGGASGGFMDVCEKTGRVFTINLSQLEKACRGILNNDADIIAKMDVPLRPFGITGRQLADYARPMFLRVQDAGPDAVEALWDSAGTLATQSSNVKIPNLAAAVAHPLMRGGRGNEVLAITGPNTLPTFRLDSNGTWISGPPVNTQVFDPEDLFNLDRALNSNNYTEF